MTHAYRYWFIGLLLVITPLFARADLISDLQAQVQALLAQIASLQAAQGSTPSQTSTAGTASSRQVACPVLHNVTMRFQDRDNPGVRNVRELQIFLATYYGVPRADIVTGFYGKVTENHIKRFQRENGIEETGITGIQTRNAIQRVCGGFASSTPTPSQGSVVQGDNGLAGVSMRIEPESASTFTAWFNLGQHTYYKYEIDWGEGDSSSQTNRSRVVVVCNSSFSCSAPAGSYHIYEQEGEFPVILYGIKTHDNGEVARFVTARASVRVTKNTNTTATSTDPLVHLLEAPTPTVLPEGKINFKLSVEVVNRGSEEIYVPLSSVVSSSADSAAAGAVFVIKNATNDNVTSNVSSAFTRLSGGTETNNVVRIAPGSSARFQLSAIMKPVDNSWHAMQLTYIGWGWSDVMTPKNFIPSKFRTPSAALSANASGPTCVLTPNKTSYVSGEPITFSWTSENATWATWVPDTSGKENIAVGGDKLAVSGSQTFTWNGIGYPSVALAVYNAAGQKGTCTGSVLVTSETGAGTGTSTTPLSCTLNGATVADGATKRFWERRYSETCGQIFQDRTCRNGTLSGNAKYDVAQCSKPLGVYKGYMNGNIFITTRDITEAEALTNCKRNANDNPSKIVTCTWEGRTIYPLTTSSVVPSSFLTQVDSASQTASAAALSELLQQLSAVLNQMVAALSS